MKFSFFKALAATIWSGTGKKPIGNELVYLHRELMRKPKLQGVAREHGNQRRMDAWLKSVRGGYDAKRKLVDAGKGCNTLAGIPA
jgi:hypothetical protein